MISRILGAGDDLVALVARPAVHAAPANVTSEDDSQGRPIHARYVRVPTSTHCADRMPRPFCVPELPFATDSTDRQRREHTQRSPAGIDLAPRHLPPCLPPGHLPLVDNVGPCPTPLHVHSD